MLKRLLNNWSLKLTALLLAIFLWSHVRGQVNPWEIAPFKVPLEVHAPPGVELKKSSSLPRTITVTVRGPRLTLRALKGASSASPLDATDVPVPLSTGQIRAELDFTGVHSGLQSLDVKATTNSYDLDVVGTNPSEVRVDVEAAHVN